MKHYNKSLGFKYYIAHQIIAGMMLVGAIVGIYLGIYFLAVFLPFLITPFILTLGFEVDFEKKRYRSYMNYQLFRIGKWLSLPEGKFIILERLVERETARTYVGTALTSSSSYFWSEYEISLANDKTNKTTILTNDQYEKVKDIALNLSKETGKRVLYIFRKQEKWLN